MKEDWSVHGAPSGIEATSEKMEGGGALSFTSEAANLRSKECRLVIIKAFSFRLLSSPVLFLF